MIDDRNLFSVDVPARAVANAARALDASAAARAVDPVVDARQVRATLEAVDVVLDDLNAQRTRLAAEGFALSPSLFDPLHFEARQNGNATLIQSIDNFVGGTVTRLTAFCLNEANSVAERLDRAQDLLTASKNILALARGESPLRSLGTDSAEAIEGMSQDLRDTVETGLSTTAVIAIAVAVVAAVMLLRDVGVGRG